MVCVTERRNGTMTFLLDTIHGWSTASVFLRLLLAMLVGMIIGFEREYRNRGAGLKTHVLVCVGSALTMIVGEYIYYQFPGANVDLARIGAQVISGVGFLGVGTIIVTGRNEVRGLTTASGLWACACTGLAAGIGYLEGTVIILLLIVLTYFVLGRVDLRMNRFSRECHFYIELTEGVPLRELFLLLREEHVTVLNIQTQSIGVAENTVGAWVAAELPRRGEVDEFLTMLRGSDVVAFVKETGKSVSGSF